ncbi:MAG: hypothetical protein C0403_06745 [Desulfobacterium sp.]|nr:hypothetical protein [Desulfobacterium sp.]
MLKRAMDVIGAMAGIFIMAPLLIIIAVVIKFTSPGPVFYRGVRAGLHGKPFRILKFRTMVENAESLGGPTTGTNDKRVTSTGALLRRTKLDELPQFLNVLTGKMSLVGPRPEVLEVTNDYFGDEKMILQMRPGITDLASIEFISLNEIVGNDDPYAFFRKHILPKKNALRIEYVKNWSLRLDVRILLQTMIAITKKVRR